MAKYIPNSTSDTTEIDTAKTTPPEPPSAAERAYTHARAFNADMPSWADESEEVQSIWKAIVQFQIMSFKSNGDHGLF